MSSTLARCWISCNKNSSKILTSATKFPQHSFFFFAMYLLGLCTERFRMQESGQTTTLASSMRIRFYFLGRNSCHARSAALRVVAEFTQWSRAAASSRDTWPKETMHSSKIFPKTLMDMASPSDAPTVDSSKDLSKEFSICSGHPCNRPASRTVKRLSNLGTKKPVCLPLRRLLVKQGTTYFLADWNASLLPTSNTYGPWRTLSPYFRT